MRNEVSSAVDFLSNIINNKGSGWIENFKENLSDILCEHYENHWFPEKPCKGSGYRCIRITGNKMDPLLQKAGSSCGVSGAQLLSVLPAELTVWVDPEEVSYRIGEEGSIGVLYSGATNSSEEESDESRTSTPQAMETESYSTLPNQVPRYVPQEYAQSCRDQFRYVQNVPTAEGYWSPYMLRYVSS